MRRGVARLLLLAAASCFLTTAAVAVSAGQAGAQEPSAAALAQPAGAGYLWSSGPDPASGVAAHPLRLHRNWINLTKLSIVLLAAVLLTWEIFLRRSGRTESHRGLRETLLLALSIGALLAWWNFGYFRFPGYIHAHEVFNHYIGSKYFVELGYNGLYECNAVADLEAGMGPTVRQRQITNLDTYFLESTAAIVSDPGRCTRRFSHSRWSDFKHDVGWFRSRVPPETWEALQRDHGYNSTPAWGFLGSLLAHTGPASTGQIIALTLIDPVLILLAWACVSWTFGWRGTCVAVIYWGTNFPSEFNWTGGALLRYDWHAAALIGLCLMKRERPASAGFLLGFAALVRLFPITLLFGIGLKALLGMIRGRRFFLSTEHRRIAMGALLAAAMLVPASSWVAGGAGSWLEFTRNMSLHLGTPASNTVGLKSLLSYDHDARLEVVQTREADPGSVWKQARHEAFEGRRFLFWGLALGYLWLLVHAVGGVEDWAAAVLGVGTLVVFTESACYYMSILMLFGLLSLRWESIGAALCWLSVLMWVAAAAWNEFDQIFVATSAALFAFVVLATALARGRPLANPS